MQALTHRLGLGAKPKEHKYLPLVSSQRAKAPRSHATVLCVLLLLFGLLSW
jgi:hypothetical protein